MKTSEALIKFLPPIYTDEEKGINVKKFLTSAGGVSDTVDENYVIYGNITDVENNTGVHLDASGILNNVFRLEGEEDEAYRNRILRTRRKKSLGCSLPEIQAQVDETLGRVTRIVENMEGRFPISSEAIIGHIPDDGTGQLSFDELFLIIQILKDRKAGGVAIRIVITDVIETWGDVYEIFPTWGDLLEYVW